VDIGALLPVIVPVVIVQLVLIVIALRDLVRDDRRVRGGNKWLWAVVIFLFGILGPLVYLTVGRLDT
jgi:hypothetical protein